MRRKILRIIQACELSEPVLHYVFTYGRELCPEQVRIKQGVWISKGQIIWAIL